MKKQTQWLTVPEAKKLRKIGYKLKVLVIGYQKDKYLITV